MIKAIFLDIDGTLISGKRHSIKKEVIEGLKQVRKKGIQLFIASGRHMLELEELKLVEQFEFDGYLLLNGGYCTIGSQIIYDNKISQEDLKEIVKIVKENNYPCLFIESNQMYITHVNQRVIDAQASISTMPTLSNSTSITHCPLPADPQTTAAPLRCLSIRLTSIQIRALTFQVSIILRACPIWRSMLRAGIPSPYMLT